MGEGESGEDRLIQRYFRPIARHPSAFGLIDDAATLSPPPGCDLVLKTDAIVGDVHFFSDDPADTIARKALRVNLSDLAAKGAAPAGFLLTLALPDGTTEEWLADFARGLGADAEAYGCPLMGGDTVRTPGPVMVSVAAFGTLERGTMVPRGGAKPGDRIFVTGTIGDAALGVRMRHDPRGTTHWGLDARMRDYLRARYLVPEPRNALAETLRLHARAAMDVSDGLVGDLAKLCRASSASAKVEVARVPLSAAAAQVLRTAPALIEVVLTGGDDYEILCAVEEARAFSFRAAAAAAGVAVTEIGRILEGSEPPRFVDAEGCKLSFARASFSHF